MNPPLHPLAVALSLAIHAGALGGAFLLADGGGGDAPLPLAVVEIALVPAAAFVSGDEPKGAPRAPAGFLAREASPTARGAFQPHSGTPRAASIEAADSASETKPESTLLESPRSEREEAPRSGGDAPVGEEADGAPPLPETPATGISAIGAVAEKAPAQPSTAVRAPSPKPSPVSGSGPDPEMGRGGAQRQSEAAGKPSAPSTASRSDATGSEVALLAPPSAAVAGALALEGPRVTAASLANVRPKYPKSARQAGIEGRVVLRVTVAASGSSEAVVVEESSGHALLDRSALAAVRRWRFLPATRGGVFVAGEIAIPILFRLEGGKP